METPRALAAGVTMDGLLETEMCRGGLSSVRTTCFSQGTCTACFCFILRCSGIMYVVTSIQHFNALKLNTMERYSV